MRPNFSHKFHIITTNHYLRLLAPPLLFLFLLGSLFILWQSFGLPSNEELIGIIEDWFDKYGLPVVFIASLIEGALLVGNYFPGAVIIFLSVTLASSVPSAIGIVTIVTCGLFCAHLVNYALGKYGWYRLLVKFGMKKSIERAKKRLTAKGPAAIFLSYWLPNLAALTDTAAGIIRLSFKRFLLYSLFSTIVWNIIFGTFAYVFKDVALSVMTSNSSSVSITLAVIGLWIIVLITVDFLRRKKSV